MPDMTKWPVTPVQKSSMIPLENIVVRPAAPAGACGLHRPQRSRKNAEPGWKMILSMVLLLTALPQSGASAVGERAKEVENAPAATAETREENTAEARLELKLPKEEGAGNEIAFLPGRTTPTPVPRGTASGASEHPGNPAPAGAAAAPAAADPAAAQDRLLQRRPYETATRRRIWYGLGAAGHGAAAFDGWSTRRALSQNIGHEANPFLRPFAHSGSLHLAIQASPTLMDYLGHRMMTSRRAWVRKMWWVPQAAGTAASLVSGLHNMTLVP